MPMRVIAGKYRSRSLAAPPGLATRPTGDRLRETLFNILAPHIQGSVFADLYAGSGGVGIEALSRGASMVYFVDHAPAAVTAIRANLAALKIASGFRVELRSVSAALGHFPGPCDFIFLDPPYEAAEAYSSTLDLLGWSRTPRPPAGPAAQTCPTGQTGSTTPGSIVIAEHRRKMALPLANSYGALERYRVLEQGDAALSFYRFGEAAAGGQGR